MDKMVLENAIKSIFMQCLNDSGILKMIKAKLNDADETCAYKENQRQQPYIFFNENTNEINTILIEKIDEILKHQKTMESLMKSETKQGMEETDELLTKLRNYKEQNRNFVIENKNLKNENKNLEEKYRIEISKYAIFEEALEVWNCINTLNYTNRGYTENLCGSLDILAILSLGRDDGKIEQLWLYLRDMAVKGDIEKIEVSKLSSYFEFCLKVANTTKAENEKYIMLDVEPESEFNMDTCIKTSDSRQIGKIKDIIVKCVTVGKNIKYKAIVRVG